MKVFPISIIKKKTTYFFTIVVTNKNMSKYKIYVTGDWIKKHKNICVIIHDVQYILFLIYINVISNKINLKTNRKSKIFITQIYTLNYLKFTAIFQTLL